MKWYWHLLFLIVSAVAACFAGNWLDQPLWQIVEARPVSFDKYDAVRKEWTTLVGDPERKNWWIETRAGRDPTVIRRLQLDLPPLTGEYPYFGASIGVIKMSCDAVLCHEFVRVGNSNADFRIEHRYRILDSATGKLLRRFTIPDNPLGRIAGDGSKLVFAEKGNIYLYDVNTKSERSVKLGYVQCLTFSPDGRLLACVSQLTNTFYLIDWEKAVLIEPPGAPEMAVSFCFIAKDTILLTHDRDTRNNIHIQSRWRWDGTALKQVSPGIKLTHHHIFPFVRVTFNGELHVSTQTFKDWHLQFQTLFKWLADKQFPIERWFPKQAFRRWVVLNDQDQIKREYYETDSRRKRELYDQLSVGVEPDKQLGTSTITFWNENPVWPNALAVGVVLYLLLYVMVRGTSSHSRTVP